MKRAILGALLAALIPGTLSACSSDDGGDDASAPTKTVTVTAEPDPEPLTLTTENVRTKACFDDPAPADVAWLDVQWQAHVDLDEFSFELTGAKGVTQVGSAETVPPVNFGGRIGFSGEVTWEGHRKYLANNVSDITGSNIESADLKTPIEGETGLVILHLRFDPKVLGTEKGGRLAGVKASYTTVEGEEGEVRVDSPHVIRAGDCP